MKLLLDEDVPNEFIKDLKRVGHDVEHINNKCKGMTDIQVMNYAYQHKRTIISLDADFCNLKKREHYGIIKLSGKINNTIEVLLELLKTLSNSDLRNVYFQIELDKAYREEKVYSKKRHKFKHYHKIPIYLRTLEKNNKK